MDATIIDLVKRALPLLLRYPQAQWDYDVEADVLYVTFARAEATDSDLTGDDIIVRYQGDRIVGLTVLHASRRGVPLSAK